MFFFDTSGFYMCGFHVKLITQPIKRIKCFFKHQKFVERGKKPAKLSFISFCGQRRALSAGRCENLCRVFPVEFTCWRGENPEKYSDPGRARFLINVIMFRYRIKFFFGKQFRNLFYRSDLGKFSAFRLMSRGGWRCW